LKNRFFKGKMFILMNIKPSTRSIVSRTLALTFVGVLLLLLWKQQSDLDRIKKDNDQLRAQQSGILTNTLHPQLPASDTTPAIHIQQPDVSTQQVATAPIEPPPAHTIKNRLVFSGTDVHQTPTGLVATLRFKALKTGPLGLVLMSVRLPNDSDATIQSIQPTGPAIYDEGESGISGKGRFAVFHGTLGDEQEASISLGISGPAKAYIKGSCGIPAMELDIQSTNAIARPFRH
jgi:hypothetical protein